ncbi:LysM peptidoglycan-binding domain-containing protein [Ruegeria sp. SCPT10]|uniref:LysM peptidoglycan-binding domain-containing protein n=1 Tax=Ruegeria sp. SCP10 TaxID=3141377 RepID=UPI003335A189
MDAKSGNGSSGNFIWGVVAAIVALLGLGGAYLSGAFDSAPDQADAPQEQTAAAPAPEASEPSAQAADTETNAPTDAEPDTAPDIDADGDAENLAQEGAETPQITAPVLDQIFVEKDGNALLSGEAAPGSEVRVLLDGEAVHSFTVDNTGQFAEFVSIPFSEVARGLVLETSDGAVTAQSDDYLIAALPKPVEEEQVASAEPSVTPENNGADTAAPSDASDTADAGEQPLQPADTEVAEAPAESVSQAEATSEDQQVAVLRSGEEGVELVQSPSTDTTEPEQVELDTIGYSDKGDVQLTGRVTEGSAVRLYLNNRLVADVTPEAGGNWRGELQGIEPGVYTLRVDEVGTDGTVVSRLETPFKREPVEVLQAADAATTADAAAETPPIRQVTVQKGDTLWAISRERFGDGVLYVRLFDANRDLIRDPDLIYPGQIFTIPE